MNKVRKEERKGNLLRTYPKKGNTKNIKEGKIDMSGCILYTSLVLGGGKVLYYIL